MQTVPCTRFDHSLRSVGCIASPTVLFDGCATGLGKGDWGMKYEIKIRIYLNKFMNEGECIISQ